MIGCPVKICFVSTPSFAICFNTISMQRGGVFTFFKNADSFVDLIQKKINSLELPWLVLKDNNYADAKQIAVDGFDLILLAPGLKYMFYRNGFDKRKVIHISFNEYTTNNVGSIIHKIKEVLYE